MAVDARNALRDIMANPGSFAGAPGYKFALDQAQQGISRRMPRGSGNVLAALNANAVGTAQQDYGNEVQRRLAAAGLEQQGEATTGAQALERDRLALEGELGRGNLDLGRTRASNDFTIGQGGLDVSRGRLALDDTLGKGRLALDTTRAGNEHELAGRGLDDAREGRWWDYSLGHERNALMEAGQRNEYDIGQGRLGVDRYRAGTDRASATADNFYRGSADRRAWMPFSTPNDPYADRRPSYARGY